MALSSTHVHYSKVLSNVSIRYSNPAFVALQIAKRMKVTNDNDVYTVFDRSAFNVVNDVRGDGDPENIYDFGWTQEPYRIEYHGLRSKVTDKQRQNNDSVVDLDSQATEVLTEALHLGLEQRVFGAGGLLRTAANNAYVQNLDWTNLSTASPRGDVEAAINAVEEAAGVGPNTIVLTPKVARAIMRTAEYKSERQYTIDLSTQGGAHDLPDQFFGLKAVYVGALINSAKKGQSQSLSRLMSDDVWVGFVNPADELGQKMLTHAVTIMTEEYTRKWRDDEIEGDWIATNFNYTEKVVAKECGALLQSVLTS